MNVFNIVGLVLLAIPLIVILVKNFKDYGFGGAFKIIAEICLVVLYAALVAILLSYKGV